MIRTIAIAVLAVASCNPQPPNPPTPTPAPTPTAPQPPPPAPDAAVVVICDTATDACCRALVHMANDLTCQQSDTWIDACHNGRANALEFGIKCIMAARDKAAVLKCGVACAGGN